MENISLIAIDLIEAIQTDNIDNTIKYVNLFNENFISPNDDHIYLLDIIPLNNIAYTMKNALENKSLMYALDNIKYFEQEDANRIKWELTIRKYDTDAKAANDFILKVLNESNDWISISYQLYGLIKLATTSQNYDTLLLIKEKINKYKNGE